MNLNSLKTFVTFIEIGNMELAAKALGLTQPSISVQLRALEEELGVQLFMVKGKRKVPNAQGLKLYEKFRDELRSMENHWEEFRSERQEIIKIEIGGRQGFIELMADKVSYEGAMNYQQMTSKEAYEKLLKRDIDVALLSFRPTHLKIVSKKVQSIQARWFYREGLTNLKALTTEKIYDYPIVAFSAQLPFIQDWCRYYKLDSSKLKIKVTVENWYLVKSMALKHEAIALVPENITTSEHSHRDLVASNIVKPVEYFYAYHEDFKESLKLGKFKVES